MSIQDKNDYNNYNLNTNTNPPILSLIVPVYNEKDSISLLLKNISNSIKIPISVEIVYDKEDDNTLPVVKDIKNKFDFPINVIKNITCLNSSYIATFKIINKINIEKKVIIIE